jgi:hypothetical protein
LYNSGGLQYAYRIFQGLLVPIMSDYSALLDIRVELFD